jgi:hypothetical protein
VLLVQARALPRVLVPLALLLLPLVAHPSLLLSVWALLVPSVSLVSSFSKLIQPLVSEHMIRMVPV